jgi:shikimate dehydrogenase
MLGLDIDYGRIDATAPDATGLARRLRTEPEWLGLSVTMPMKQPMLAQMDVVDPLAAALGALNTVVVQRGADGVALHGFNTDVAGIVAALGAAGAEKASRAVEASRDEGTARAQAGHRPSGTGTPSPETGALVIGAGGTAAAALAALHDLGHVHVVVAVRSLDRVRELPQVARTLDMSVDFIDFAGLALLRAAPGAVVVSTLPAGAADPLAAPVAALAKPGMVLLDAAYAQWPSALAAAWNEAGGTAVHGLSMLVHQAVEQVVAFTGRAEARNEEFRAALCDEVGITRDGTAALHVAG